MKPNTKAKLEMRWNKVKEFLREWGIPLGVGATVGAAWGSYFSVFSLDKRIRGIHAQQEEIIKIVENNADCQIADRQRMLELERQQNLLFERALKETEGKT